VFMSAIESARGWPDEWAVRWGDFVEGEQITGGMGLMLAGAYYAFAGLLGKGCRALRRKTTVP
jgi:hypothetical protein